MMKRVALILLTLVLSGVGHAKGSIITAHTTIDLNSAITGSSWTGVAHPLDNTVTVASGDTVIINIDFEPGQTLTWNSTGSYFNPWLMLDGFPGSITDPTQSGSFSWSNTSVSFLNLTEGSQFGPATLVDGSSSTIHLGPTFTLGNDSQLRTFSGVSLSFTAMWSDGDPVRSYSTIGYYTPLFGGSVSFTEISTIPEPSSLALFGMMTASAAGYFGWRRRKQPVAG